MQVFEGGIASPGKGEVIYLIDDDERVVEALSELLECMGRNVVCFATAREYLDHHRTDAAACLIVDIKLPGMSGLDLQSKLARELHPPIVFITGHADVPSAVRAMKAGAIEFLTKPVSQNALITAIDAALQEDRRRRHKYSELARLRSCFALLTPREREVFHLVANGLLNKQAAAELGIRTVTLQVHRTQVMKKMAARSFAELVRNAVELGIPAGGLSSTLAG